MRVRSQVHRRKPCAQEGCPVRSRRPHGQPDHPGVRPVVQRVGGVPPRVRRVLRAVLAWQHGYEAALMNTAKQLKQDKLLRDLYMATDRYRS